MRSAFTNALPKELVTHVAALCGQRGEEWFDELPGIIEHLERSWGLVVEPPFPAIEFNFVAPAVRENGDLAVVKIAPPFESVEIFGEAKFLRTADGHASVRLLGEDTASRAILIERAIPGASFTDEFASREPEVIQPAIKVLRSILLSAPADLTNIILLDDWFDGLRRYPDTGFPSSYAARALEIYGRLSTQPGRTFYLHGDFHPGNVVTATREQYLAIDPKGIFGHVGYDIAVFLNNFHWWQETRPDVRERLGSAVTQFSDAFDFSPGELREWAFAQMVLGAWWTFDEMPETYNNEVVKADIWDV